MPKYKHHNTNRLEFRYDTRHRSRGMSYQHAGSEVNTDTLHGEKK
jgi:hypothetical protein